MPMIFRYHTSPFHADTALKSSPVFMGRNFCYATSGRFEYRLKILYRSLMYKNVEWSQKDRAIQTLEQRPAKLFEVASLNRSSNHLVAVLTFRRKREQQHKAKKAEQGLSLLCCINKQKSLTLLEKNYQ